MNTDPINQNNTLTKTEYDAVLLADAISESKEKSIRQTILFEDQNKLANRYNLKKYMEFFNLGHYNTYFTLLLDPLTAGVVQKYLTGEMSSPHLAVITYQNQYQSTRNIQYQGRPIETVDPNNPNKDQDYEVEYSTVE